MTLDRIEDELAVRFCGRDFTDALRLQEATPLVRAQSLVGGGGKVDDAAAMAAATLVVFNELDPDSRELAAFPSPSTRASKFWPAVGRVDNVYGDRNLVCSCVGMEAYADAH